jgi:anion-transporting  ArsA/GET3 family ATPase
VRDLLRDPSSGFVLVAGPSSQALEEALYFHRRLGEKEMPFVAQIVNRVHPDPAQEEEGKEARQRSGRGAPREPQIDPALAKRLAEVFRDQQTLARVERRRIDRMEVDAGERPILVPELEQDVHDLRGLVSVADAIFGGTRAALRARQRA